MPSPPQSSQSSSAPATIPSLTHASNWHARHVVALVISNLSMGIGPLFVRLADTGPAATAFWRHLFAMPLLAALMLWREPASAWRPRGGTFWIVLAGGALFGLNLAFAYTGFTLTRLGNVVLLGNSGGLLLMIWGVIAMHRVPRPLEGLAIACALTGAGLLIAGSLRISYTSFKGDLMGVGAGVCYAGYLLILRHARSGIGQFTLLFWASLASMPILLVVAVLLNERIVGDVWWPVITLTFTGQIIGQGLLIYSLRHFSAVVIGLALLTQPAISAAVGWVWFGESLSAGDITGMVLLAAALVLSRAAEERQLAAAIRAARG